jgi:hypothetical protein
MVSHETDRPMPWVDLTNSSFAQRCLARRREPGLKGAEEEGISCAAKSMLSLHRRLLCSHLTSTKTGDQHFYYSFA